ncbi:MAG: hemolysin III family protein [Bacteriovoracaceae bacterium]|jgi:hemolysin III|nr:hemolysin III family protein [Bacteriovoracaceae bacterium]
MKEVKLFQYSESEEIANVITHLFGIFFGIFVLFSLLFSLPNNYSNFAVASCLIYSLSLIALYSASTSYHFVKSDRLKVKLKKADHICIYYVIAGTYTPFLLVSIGGNFGTSFFLFIWILALLGTFFKLIHSRKFQKLSLIMYLAMGWLALTIWNPLVKSVSEEGVKLIIVGGLFYTFGVIFYSMKKMRYHHMIWHLFVLFGSIAHYFAIKTIVF